MINITADAQFDIIIQAGQSNSEGCGIGRAAEEYAENPDILYLNGDFKIAVAGEAVAGGEKVNNFSLAFAREYVRLGRLAAGRKLLIVRTAVGGTGFCDARWGPRDDLYLRMLGMTAAALSLGRDSRLVAYLWHQGETDVIRGASEALHYDNLRFLIESFRAKFFCPGLPFIVGGFVNEWETQNAGICAPVIGAIRGVCRDIGRAVFVETEDLQSNNQDTGNGDIIHFSREALNRLGKRYFEAFSEFFSH
ncbi:MAG: sialate O-acetylesterase [Firmicutes bacterium]|nr:sialate O-acetylesterase [Bacillota bacterium]